MWRSLNGPEQDVVFEQRHKPGRLLQLDWTDCNCLDVVVAGRPFPHKLCHCAAVYSRWEWARVCFSEDFLSFRTTLQDGLFALGGVPRRIQTDCTSAATHQLRKGEPAREFTSAVKGLLRHFGIADAHMINPGQAHENGSVEALNGHFKRRLKQALLLRGSRRFISQDEYERFVRTQLDRANGNRGKRLAEERTALGPLPPCRYPEYESGSHRAGSTATVWIKRKIYSVPSQLKGQRLASRIYPERIELYLHNQLVHQMARSYGSNSQAGLDWRHLAPGLLRKPGAFTHYRYRQVMFPGAEYEQLCGLLQERLGNASGDREYLQLLNASAGVAEPEALAAVTSMLSGKTPLSVEGFRAATGLARPAFELAPFVPDLRVYDRLVEDLGDE
jgi:hypothetical protein